MRVLVAMSGGVDSSVAAALALEAGHDVTGVTMKLWGGRSDTGCCSVGDIEDARRVASQLGIVHRVFNFTSEFEQRVVDTYIGAHLGGETPNPCIECNRHIKFDRLLQRAVRLGFDLLATGHHARVVQDDGGHFGLWRGRDASKDQSYVVSMLGQKELSKVIFPVGEMTKDEVRRKASSLGLRTAGKPDSQDVCFIGKAQGRAGFLKGRNVSLHPGKVVDPSTGALLGEVPAIELVTVGQRRGLGIPAPSEPFKRLYVTEVDMRARTVKVGGSEDQYVKQLAIGRISWVDRPLEVGSPVVLQCSAHGTAGQGWFQGGHIELQWATRRVAPGQTVAMYDATDPERVVGSAIASSQVLSPRI